ncbi:MAG: Gfo/Idh/MocA family oxidoreductase [Verrucomicrobia bacterium]|nr:Gfo/Idh/MocA family oxidoreductase [Verrucomicrobiota bacterium]
MSMNPRRVSRRQFLKQAAATGAAAGAFPHLMPSSVFGADGAVAPSNRVTMACIGFGGEGHKNLRAHLNQPDAHVVAVCDVDAERAAAARDKVNEVYKNKDCACYNDFRELLGRADIDAVQISTPDHWHTPMALRFLRAGKDVICEKPTLCIAEGRLLIDTIRRTGRIFQTSMEDRALFVYHRMAELVRNGRIGKLQRIHVGLPSQPLEPGDPTPQPVPPGFNYDLWLGPAPWAPYCTARVHRNFRWVSDYSVGIIADWGAHLFDTAQWANNTEFSGPVEVEGKGKRFDNGLYDTFYEFELRYRYANGVEMLADTAGVRLRFEGTDGWVGNTGWIGKLEASSPDILNSPIRPEELKLFTCPGGEHRNFLDCVKSRRRPYFPAEISHRVSAVAHIGNAAMLLGRKLRWDPVAERYLNDDTANRLRNRFCREPWTLEG